MNTSERQPLLVPSEGDDLPRPFIPRRTSFQQQLQQFIPGRGTRAQRSDSLASTTSIMSRLSTISTYVLQSPIFNLPKVVKRFIAIVLWALFAIGVFELIFLPRTSLSRDFRRIHFGIVGRSEVERLYLRSFDEGNDISRYLIDCHERSYVFGEERDELKEYMIDNFKTFGHYVENKRYWVSMTKYKNNSLTLQEDNVFTTINLEDGMNRGNNSFHIYSKSGKVTSEFVYVGFGEEDDYDLLNKEEIKDKILVIRSKNIENQFKLAEKYGGSGIVLFKHPEDGIKEDEIDIVSVKYDSWPGDPTTFAYPCLRSYWCHRDFNSTNKIPTIPSLSVNYLTAKELIKNSGDGSKLILENNNIQMVEPLDDVFFEIPGLLDEIVIIGAPRDSINRNYGSKYNGGVEASANALLLGLSEHLGKLVKKGWRPLRTIKIISWDGSKSGYLGSTEFCKDEKLKLGKKVVSYINLKGITGKNFHVESNPLLIDYLIDTSKKVNMGTDDDIENNLYNSWDKKLNSLKFDDYSYFQYSLGIPSCSIEFTDSQNKRIDEIDPDMNLHEVMVKYIGLLILQISEHETLKFNTEHYYEEVAKKIEGYELSEEMKLNLKEFKTSTIEFDQDNKILQEEIHKDFPWFKLYVKVRLLFLIKIFGNISRRLDMIFISDDESILKHLIWNHKIDLQLINSKVLLVNKEFARR